MRLARCSRSRPRQRKRIADDVERRSGSLGAAFSFFAITVKHARHPALDSIEPLLERLRQNPALIERSRGVFYWRSRACVHFHEDPAGIFADVRVADRWQRLPVDTADEQRGLVELLEPLASTPRRRAPRAPGGTQYEE